MCQQNWTKVAFNEITSVCTFRAQHSFLLKHLGSPPRLYPQKLASLQLPSVLWTWNIMSGIRKAIGKFSQHQNIHHLRFSALRVPKCSHQKQLSKWHTYGTWRTLNYPMIPKSTNTNNTALVTKYERAKISHYQLWHLRLQEVMRIHLNGKKNGKRQ